MRLTTATLARYFKRYIERELYDGTLQQQWKPLVGWKSNKKKDWEWNYTENRPWTDDFKKDNPPGKRPPKVFVEPIRHQFIFKGDRVEILVGKDKGKQGIVNSIIKERNWCYVEGLNCEFKIQQQNRDVTPMCFKEEKPLLMTNQVKLVDPSDEKPSVVQWRYTETGERVRVSERTGRIIPLPKQAHTLEDFVLPSTYVESDEKDTKEKELTEVTFEPKLCTFETDIMNEMGIKEERKRTKTYWY